MPPVSPDVLASMPHWVVVLLTVLGAVVPTFSLLASLINAYVRAAKAREEKVPTWMLAVASVVNVGALNPDKSVEAVKAMKAPEVAP
jgi:hypothetical protein